MKSLLQKPAPGRKQVAFGKHIRASKSHSDLHVSPSQRPTEGTATTASPDGTLGS